ncbi:hypothetical protein CMQ_1209 [Grosmannia clavigera kw1407]|uniref:Uncharacterized protein n=1 Tax=Grosmannia clavigera (strain kw1407 / UAMH 11150) TaxID=655863 RepID=F0XE32_GROCL|nr:uncharacterized protein CMQ_1209 [Grosmannia clavigera kw1407]EFX04281.1 hypothetical protein CMQ_1209 [Grosmannia clavigera kw1407]
MGKPHVVLLTKWDVARLVQIRKCVMGLNYGAASFFILSEAGSIGCPRKSTSTNADPRVVFAVGHIHMFGNSLYLATVNHFQPGIQHILQRIPFLATVLRDAHVVDRHSHDGWVRLLVEPVPYYSAFHSYSRGQKHDTHTTPSGWDAKFVAV